MSGFKFLIDTNVVIGLEDAKPVQASLAELVRLSSEHSVGLFIDEATYEDVARDVNVARRTVTFSKLAKFQRLRAPPPLPESELARRFGAINNDNDRSDTRLLIALEAKAVDFVITQDAGLHRRADRAGLGQAVFTIEEALEWLRQTFQVQTVQLPYVVERKAYEINLADKIFESLRRDYSGFDAWFDKCRRQHRECWALEIGSEIAGLVIRKDEDHMSAGTRHAGPKILKVCTLKVRDEYRGEKFGELLLKQVLWFAQRNKYDLVYLTVYPKHTFLVDLLVYFGFQVTATMPTQELLMEKVMTRGHLSSDGVAALEFDRLHYPRFSDAEHVRKFCIPIRPDYHRRLFPEIAFAAELPLFPTEMFGPVLDSRRERTPGNTIRKVYLCRAKSERLRPGDLLFFYMSKDANYASSQSITTVGVVEQVVNATRTDELVRLTAKRSVFSAEELSLMTASDARAVKLIDFLLVGHSEPAVRLDELVRSGVFTNRPPQSITELSASKYATLKPFLKLGFEL
jgi:GNAT superfamily N-acetyltransferase